jgi:hypothetical protein
MKISFAFYLSILGNRLAISEEEQDTKEATKADGFGKAKAE